MGSNVSVHVKIQGLDELQEKLKSLPLQLSKKIMRRALRAAVVPWREEMRLLAHKDTGWMAQNLSIRTSVRGDELEGSAKVGPSSKQNPSRKGHEKHVPGASNEALWNEFGTVKMPAQPFIRPAFESKKDTVLQTFIDKVKDLLAETFA